MTFVQTSYFIFIVKKKWSISIFRRLFLQKHRRSFQCTAWRWQLSQKTNVCVELCVFYIMEFAAVVSMRCWNQVSEVEDAPKAFVEGHCGREPLGRSAVNWRQLRGEDALSAAALKDGEQQKRWKCCRLARAELTTKGRGEDKNRKDKNKRTRRQITIKKANRKAECVGRVSCVFFSNAKLELHSDFKTHIFVF